MVAQLVERSLPTPEISVSNPNINIRIVQYKRKDKNKEKEARNSPWLKKHRMGQNFSRVDVSIGFKKSFGRLILFSQMILFSTTGPRFFFPIERMVLKWMIAESLEWRLATNLGMNLTNEFKLWSLKTPEMCFLKVANYENDWVQIIFDELAMGELLQFRLK